MAEKLSVEERRRANRIFEAVLDLPPEQRNTYLDEELVGQERVRGLVDRLLENAGEDSTGIDTPISLKDAVAAVLPSLGKLAEPHLESGHLIGRYRILDELGRGGMAVVYLAERADGAFDQKVALKVIRPHLKSEDARRRFDQERQILGLLNHPGMASLLDGGLTEDERPYLVMEFVDGDALDTYCDRERLTLSQRLELFIQTARAVAFAHRNLIIHRDIKPSNIRVTPDGHVKLLDFGIAKLLDEAATPWTAPATQTHHRLMTPPFASPEQVKGEPVSTATDIYQLGVLLYTLLTGCLPFAHKDTGDLPLAKAICEEKPLSLRATLERERSGEFSNHPPVDLISEQRRSSLGRLKRDLGGDLEIIALKALRKEPARRYESVLQMVEDVERYLQGLPIKARPDSLPYRMGKFFHRHAAAATVAATSVVLMAVLIVVYGLNLTQERDKARREAEKKTEVSRFLRGLFSVNLPTRSQGETLTARELLDQGAERLEELREEPEIHAEMARLIGEIYVELALYEEARPHLETAMEFYGANPTVEGVGWNAPRFSKF